MRHASIPLMLFALLALMWSCKSLPEGSPPPANKVPYLPSAEVLEKLSLELVWHAEVESCQVQKAYLFRDLVCLETAALELYAIDASTGLIRWQTHLSAPLREPPCDNCKLLFLIDSGRLYAFEKNTGHCAWWINFYFSATAPPVASEEAVFVPVAGNDVHGYAAADGKRAFDFHAHNNISATPAAEGSTLYVADDAGWVYSTWFYKKEFSFERKPRPARDQLWEKQTRAGVAAPLELSEKLLLVGSKDYKIYALDRATGAPAWQDSTGSMIMDQPICVEGLVYVPSLENGILAYNLASGEQVWKSEEGMKFVAAAGNVNAYLLNGQNKILALDKKSGKALWRLTPSRYDFVLTNPWTSPIYLVSKDGRVVAIAERGAKMLTYKPPAPPAPKPAAPKKAAPPPSAPKKTEE